MRAALHLALSQRRHLSPRLGLGSAGAVDPVGRRLLISGVINRPGLTTLTDYKQTRRCKELNVFVPSREYDEDDGRNCRGSRPAVRKEN